MLEEFSLDALIGLVILLIKWILPIYGIFFVFRIARVLICGPADKIGFEESRSRCDTAIREFRELVDSAETDSQVWSDFWERNDEFRDEIMKLK